MTPSQRASLLSEQVASAMDRGEDFRLAIERLAERAFRDCWSEAFDRGAHDVSTGEYWPPEPKP